MSKHEYKITDKVFGDVLVNVRLISENPTELNMLSIAIKNAITLHLKAINKDAPPCRGCGDGNVR